jgi:hypothetical protein
MKTLFKSLLLAIGALALAGTAYAQVPSTNDTSDSNSNTGMGTGALHVNTGSNNTASGDHTLYNNTTGGDNSAFGYEGLYSNTTGYDNTASGFQALWFNTTGAANTASGDLTLFSNTSGNENNAFGFKALYSNSIGNDNTASGYNAMESNTTGNDNTASGVGALQSNTTASNNTASGVEALFSNTTGTANAASGFQALVFNTSGSNNIAMGYQAGQNLTIGSNNIDIGNVGVAGEDNTIRIGTKGTHKATVIAGIISSKITGSAVYVTTTGRLGVLASSERFKTAIAPMGADTAKLAQLRPVSFKLKSDATATRQYGLIAEEVAKVYPELVIRNENGRIDGVRYDELAPMLLNEAQKQSAEIRELKQQQLRMQQQVAALTAINQATQVALRKLLVKDEFVAQR